MKYKEKYREQMREKKEREKEDGSSHTFEIVVVLASHYHFDVFL
ncbi:hypothetical protein ACVK1V_003259 [Bacillus subtilis]|jgi:hypothetical protein|nr:hypothetical protein EH5_03392 [Bacillus subtilis]